MREREREEREREIHSHIAKVISQGKISNLSGGTAVKFREKYLFKIFILQINFLVTVDPSLFLQCGSHNFWNQEDWHSYFLQSEDKWVNYCY